MSAAELQERPDVEIELVERWRAQSLARVGYDLESAAVLAASHEVDLHLAMRLVENGSRSISPSRSFCKRGRAALDARPAVGRHYFGDAGVLSSGENATGWA